MSENIKQVIRKTFKGKENQIYVYDYYYTFKMSFKERFGQGKYDGCSLGNFSNTGWYWELPEDDALDGYFYHLSRSKVDKSKLIEAITKAGVLEDIKKDLLKCSHYWILRVICGWRQFEELWDAVSSDIGEHYSYLSMNAKTKKEKEALENEKDEVLNAINENEIEKMFEKICKDRRILNFINDDIKTIRRPEQLVKFLEVRIVDIWEIIMSYYVSEYVDKLQEKVSKKNKWKHFGGAYIERKGRW